MTIPQFFVYKRPVAWTALVASLVWGYLAYRVMPQRHDPIIPIQIATVITIYPARKRKRFEQEVSRKIEKQLSRCGKVEKVYSLSRQNLSVVFVELFESVKDTEQVWQDLQGRLDSMNDLPTIMGRPLKPRLNKDFGESVAMMLTISSPKVSDFEIAERARSIRSVLASFRAGRPDALRRNRVAAVLVYPNTVERSYVLWLGQSLLQRLATKGLIVDGHIVEAPSTGCLDFQLADGVSEEQLKAECLRWDRDTAQSGLTHPDMWPGVLVGDLGRLEAELRHTPRDTMGGRIATVIANSRRFADLIRDRLKQYGTIDTIDQIGLQDEVVNLFYSGRRFSSLGLSPLAIAQRLEARNINLPGGQVETVDQKVTVHPSGEFKDERELGEVVLDVQRGYPTYLRDVVDIVRGYEDPPGVMNFRSVKVDADDPPEAKMPGELRFGPDAGDEKKALPQHPRLQTTRAVTLSVRQIKGSHIEQFARDVDAAMTSLKGVLPEDLCIEWTHDEPAKVREKIHQFDRNFIEAVVIVVIVALLFMEWRSALLGGDFHPGHRGANAWGVATHGDRSAAGFDRGHDYRARLACGLPRGRRRCDQSGNRPWTTTRRGVLARPAEVGPRHFLRYGHQLRGIFTAALGQRQDRPLHLFFARCRYRVAGGQLGRFDDVHAIARFLCPARAKRIRVGHRRKGVRSTGSPAATEASRDGRSTTRRSRWAWQSCC